MAVQSALTPRAVRRIHPRRTVYIAPFVPTNTRSPHTARKATRTAPCPRRTVRTARPRARHIRPAAVGARGAARLARDFPRGVKLALHVRVRARKRPWRSRCRSSGLVRWQRASTRAATRAGKVCGGVPGAHCSHTVAALMLVKVPGSQLSHVACPISSVNVPGAQASHDVIPSAVRRSLGHRTRKSAHSPTISPARTRCMQGCWLAPRSCLVHRPARRHASLRCLGARGARHARRGIFHGNILSKRAFAALTRAIRCRKRPRSTNIAARRPGCHCARARGTGVAAQPQKP